MKTVLETKVKNKRTIVLFFCTLLIGISTLYANDGDWVLINGVKWATRNVAAPGTFAASETDAGMFYQWNRKVGWSSTDPMVNSNGGTTWNPEPPTGTEWTAENDPSPAGYRVPKLEDIESLLNTTYVTNEWTTQNGVNGRKFTDKSNGNSIFLPAAGGRLDSGGALGYAGAVGGYWSSSARGSYEAGACYLGFLEGNASWIRSNRRVGFSIRAVAE